MQNNILKLKILIILAGIFLGAFGFTTISQAAIYYVDRTLGSDNNNGATISSAWKTIAKVNSSYFNPGDQILFKRGGIWSENLTFPSSGSDGNPITIGTYGSGNSPIINRLIITKKSYLNFSVIQTTSVGTDPGLYIGWSHDINFTNTIHDGASQVCFAAVVLGAHNSQTWSYNIVFDGCVFKNSSMFDGANLTINAYSHDITVKNSESFGATVGPGTNGMQVYDSQGNYGISSPYNIFFLNNKVHDNANGIEIGWGVSDSSVLRNYVYSNNAGNGNGIIISHLDASVQSGNIVTYNWIDPHRYGIVVAPNSTNNYIYNNTVLMNAVVSSYAGIWFQTGTGTGNVAKNNIIYASGLSGNNPLMLIQDNADVTSDYNLYFNTVSATGMFGAENTPTYYANFADWKAAVTQDANSKWTDPLFVNSSSDFHLQSTSPAINVGTNVGLTRDYVGTAVPQGSAPDIGAYEYVGAPATRHHSSLTADKYRSAINYNSTVLRKYA